MKEIKQKKWLQNLNDIHHVILAECGVVLLLLPFFTEVSKEQERNMFIAAIVLMAYGITLGMINERAKRKQNMFNKNNTKQR